MNPGEAREEWAVCPSKLHKGKRLALARLCISVQEICKLSARLGAVSNRFKHID